MEVHLIKQWLATGNLQLVKTHLKHGLAAWDTNAMLGSVASTMKTSLTLCISAVLSLVKASPCEP